LAFPDTRPNAYANAGNNDGEGGRGYGYSCSCRETAGGGGGAASSSLAAISDDGDPALAALQEQLGHTCRTSKLAALGDPRHNKNYRNNPSLLISHRNNDDDQTFGEEPVPVRNVIIDCGKTFRETALRWMPANGIRSIDAIVLTHEHMDAVAGLDDVRGFQRRNAGGALESTPVFLSRETFEAIRKQFFYLVPKGDAFKPHDGRIVQESSDGKAKVVRAVASLQYQLIEQFGFQPFVAAGLRMVPLPVMHGEDLVCLGFAFTVNSSKAPQDKAGSNEDMELKSGGLNVVYLSDISRMLPTTEAYILEKLPPTDVLIVDSLLVDRKHSVHYSLKQALELARRLKPTKTFIVGINCDDFQPHDEANQELKKIEGLDVQLAFDGLVIDA
jgi:phosphoribosyl 1,2-cyclic phosphodiesterase